MGEGCRYHNTRWYAVQETATLAAAGNATDWTLNVNLGAVGIAADDAATYYRNLEVSSADR